MIRVGGYDVYYKGEPVSFSNTYRVPRYTGERTRNLVKLLNVVSKRERWNVRYGIDSLQFGTTYRDIWCILTKGKAQCRQVWHGDMFELSNMTDEAYIEDCIERELDYRAREVREIHWRNMEKP